MTTYFNFQPSTLAPFQFQPTLDGDVYTGIVSWNTFGQRYYLNLFALDGTRVVTEALVGSPTGVPVQGLSWSHGRVTVVTAKPHGFSAVQNVELTISGCSPDGYNGKFLCLTSDLTTLSYALATDPGAATVFGSVSYDINLVTGYFETSSLVFRDGSQQFEVSP